MSRVLPFLAALSLAVPAAAQDVARFSVTDHLSDGQSEETITVYIDGKNVGTLHVGPGKTTDRIEVSAPRADRYDYALCGRLRVQIEGRMQEREINDGGTLYDADGRSYAAYTEGQATFYLLDDTPDRPTARVERDDKPRCTAAVASR